MRKLDLFQEIEGESEYGPVSSTATAPRAIEADPEPIPRDDFREDFEQETV